METDNTPLETGLELSELKDDELLEKYNNAAEDSEEFETIKAELDKRGYTFEPETEAEDGTDGITSSLASQSPARKIYSSLGSLLWELIYTGLALAGAIYFLSSMGANEVEIGTRVMITTALVVLFLVSLGVMAGAVRRLANQKSDAQYQFASPGYIVLSFLWSITTLGALYYAIKNFVEVLKYSFKYALMSAILPLVGVMVSIAFVAFFLTLSLEAKR